MLSVEPSGSAIIGLAALTGGEAFCRSGPRHQVAIRGTASTGLAPWKHCCRLLLSNMDNDVAIPHPIRERSARCPHAREAADPIIRLDSDEAGHSSGVRSRFMRHGVQSVVEISRGHHAGVAESLWMIFTTPSGKISLSVFAFAGEATDAATVPPRGTE